jgi:hypothetical protein
VLAVGRSLRRFAPRFCIVSLRSLNKTSTSLRMTHRGCLCEHNRGRLQIAPTRFQCIFGGRSKPLPYLDFAFDFSPCAYILCLLFGPSRTPVPTKKVRTHLQTIIYRCLYMQKNEVFSRVFRISLGYVRTNLNMRGRSH